MSDKANAQRSASDAEPKIKVVFVGHVDHGKSTLIGRILHDTDSLPEGKIEHVKKACAAEGMEFEFAFLLDALLEEQEQNVTIDTTAIPFRTDAAPLRHHRCARTQGISEEHDHRRIQRGCSDPCDRSADEGVREQSRRHAYLLSMLGIKHIIVVVNKMDLVDYSEKRFREIEQEYRKFLRELGLDARIFIPASAREGENVARASVKMKWYDAANVLEALDLLEPQQREVDLPLRFCVQDVYRFDGRRIIAGRIETGTLKAGDQLVFSPANKSSVVLRSSVGTCRRMVRLSQEIPSESRSVSRFSWSAAMSHRMKMKPLSRQIVFMRTFSGSCASRCALDICTTCGWRLRT